LLHTSQILQTGKISVGVDKALEAKIAMPVAVSFDPHSAGGD
jgi:hypothetical protein